MTLSELVVALSHRTSLPQSVVKDVMKAFAEETTKVVGSGERLVLPGFGTFVYVKPAARELFGEGKKSECRGRIRFRQSRRKNGEAGRRD